MEEVPFENYYIVSNNRLMKLNTDKGYTEAVINENCDYEEFYKVAALLRHTFQIVFITQLNDFDSYYWDFKYMSVKLTLHYNIYLGISLFPTSFSEATHTENEVVVKLATELENNILQQN